MTPEYLNTFIFYRWQFFFLPVPQRWNYTSISNCPDGCPISSGIQTKMKFVCASRWRFV